MPRYLFAVVFVLLLGVAVAQAVGIYHDSVTGQFIHEPECGDDYTTPPDLSDPLYLRWQTHGACRKPLGYDPARHRLVYVGPTAPNRCQILNGVKHGC